MEHRRPFEVAQGTGWVSKLFNKIILQFCNNCKIRSFTDYLGKKLRGKSLFARKRKIESLIEMILGDAVKKSESFVWIFKPCLNVYTLISLPHKSIKLCHMIHLNVIFHVVVWHYWFVIMSTCPTIGGSRSKRTWTKIMCASVFHMFQ